MPDARSAAAVIRITLRYAVAEAFLADFALRLSRNVIHLDHAEPLPDGKQIELCIEFPGLANPCLIAGQVAKATGTRLYITVAAGDTALLGALEAALAQPPPPRSGVAAALRLLPDSGFHARPLRPGGLPD
jgi:hypothetical protein